MMLTTGISMLGKMSVGVRTIASVPKRKIKIPSTTMVYGSFSASLTIHIVHIPQFRPACPDCINLRTPTACAWASWHRESRPSARLQAEQRQFRTEQEFLPECSCRTHDGYRHCPGG